MDEDYMDKVVESQPQKTEERKSFLRQSIDNVKSMFSKKDKDGKDKKGFMQQIKEMGPAGLISFTLWGGSIRNIYLVVSVLLFQQATGAWPNFRSAADWAKITAEWWVIINIMRPFEPVRFALAMSTAPWVDKHIVKRFAKFRNKGKNVEN